MSENSCLPIFKKEKKRSVIEIVLVTKSDTVTAKFLLKKSQVKTVERCYLLPES